MKKTAAEMSGELARKFEDFDADAATMYTPGTDELPWRIALVRAAAQRAYYEGEADRIMREAVDAARAEGISWHQIGGALGTTGEAARQRYAHKKAS